MYDVYPMTDLRLPSEILNSSAEIITVIIYLSEKHQTETVLKAAFSGVYRRA